MTPVSVSAERYIGRYGGISTDGSDLVVVTVQCGPHPPSLHHKQIIFAVDVSGSMEEELPSVKASLFAARTALLSAVHIDTHALSEEALDAEFVLQCQCSIVVFSGTATCIWDSHTAQESFTSAVKSISIDSRTNLSEGLLVSFQKVDPNCATWIIVLTDGVPNCGRHLRAESFANLVGTMPPHTKIVPLGYGTEFDPDILSALGVMTYIESREFISSVMGSIMGEIATCYGLSGIIALPSASGYKTDIIVPVAIPHDIIGSSHVGTLYSERTFMYGVVHHVGTSGSFTYFDLTQWDTVRMDFVITEGGIIPDTVRSNYFMAAKGRLLRDIYRRRTYKTVDAHFVKKVTTKLEDWTDPLACADKEEILWALDINMNRVKHLKIASGVAQYHTQTSYERRSLATGPQRILSDLAHNIPGTHNTGILPI